MTCSPKSAKIAEKRSVIEPGKCPLLSFAAPNEGQNEPKSKNGQWENPMGSSADLTTLSALTKFEENRGDYLYDPVALC